MFKRLTQGIAKTRQNLVAGLKSLTGSHQQLNAEDIESLETALLMADCGVEATDEPGTSRSDRRLRVGASRSTLDQESTARGIGHPAIAGWR